MKFPKASQLTAITSDTTADAEHQPPSGGGSDPGLVTHRASALSSGRFRPIAPHRAADKTADILFTNVHKTAPAAERENVN